MDSVLYDWRSRVIYGAMKRGVCVAHRPAGVKFDEPNALLLPDLHTHTETGLSVGDEVTVNIARAVPWATTEDWGEYNQLHTLSSRAYQGHERFRFVLLCFAEVTTKRKRISAKGMFAIIDGKSMANAPSIFCPGDGPHQQEFALYWVGSLEKCEAE